MKIFRIAFSVVFFIAITLLFIDFKQIIPSQWFDIVTYFQFVPSVLKAISFAGIASFGFVIVVLLTFLFGRVYCSLLCPLGVFQDIVSFIARKTKKKHRLKFANEQRILRYSFLGLTVVFLLFGSTFVLYLLDPYSNYGRFASDIFRPIVININNGIAALLGSMKIYAVTPLDIVYVSIGAISFTIVFFVVVVVLSFIKGRIYCNTVCPVGTLLGLLSKVSLFRIVIDKTSCIQCGKCATNCKSQCISMKDKYVDTSRCVACFNCLGVCDRDGINYKLMTYKKATTVETEVDKSKRNFIVGSAIFSGTFLGLSHFAKAKELVVENNIVVKKNALCSPPGSVSHEHFNTYCTSCHLCVSACPEKVLQPAFMEYGLGGLMQPFLNNSKGFCSYECTICSTVCPTGAIIPLTIPEKKTTQMGKVVFIQENCIVYREETACGACSEHCPTQAVYMVDYKNDITIPNVNVDICIGCGACEYICPAKPNKAIYIDGNVVQQIAKLPEVKKSESKAVEEFPF